MYFDGEEIKEPEVNQRHVQEAVDAQELLVDDVDPFDFYEDALGG